MKRTFAPAGLLFMGLMVGLATLGLVVGMWSKVLDINGSVTTGGINAEVQFENADDSESDPKQVAECRGFGIDTADLEGEKNDKLRIEITNAYPEYECVVTFTVANNGKIPIVVHTPNEATTNPWVKVTTDPATCYRDLEQINVGSKTVPCQMTVTVNQIGTNNELLPQNSDDLEFQTRICYQQFNADETAAECKEEAKNIVDTGG